jgi:hypothetical protein
MNNPNPRSARDQYLYNLSHSDETIEDLLSSGANIDDLIEAGVLDDEDGLTLEPEPRQSEASTPLDPNLVEEF